MTCEECKREILENENAEMELEENFPTIDKEDCVILCDDCYTYFMKKLYSGQFDLN